MFQSFIVHTGQHYDFNMSDSFFYDLELPEPHYFLGVGSGSHTEQTARTMLEFEKVLLKERPHVVIVVGDVNSTLACALVVSKTKYCTSNYNPLISGSLNRPLLAHVEAGLRSFDMTMPEEVNRILTDSISDVLFTHSSEANQNLLREGVSPEKIKCVGNVMIDALEFIRPKIEKQRAFCDMGLPEKGYGIITLHRPSNVDRREILSKIINLLGEIASGIPLEFPVHPRTRKMLVELELHEKLSAIPNIKLLDPLSYMVFMDLLFHCRFVLTDSGGLQEETTYLNIPCLTLRKNTERPITVQEGTNELVDLDTISINIEPLAKVFYKYDLFPLSKAFFKFLWFVRLKVAD